MATVIVAGILLPIICALVIALVSGWLRRGSSSWRERVGWDGALLLIVFAVCNLALVGWHGFPPSDVKFWPIFIALAAVPLAGLAASLGHWSVRLALTLALVGGASVLLLRPELCSNSTTENAELLAAVMVGWLVTMTSWSFAAKSSEPGPLLSGLLITTASSAFGLLLFGTITYAQVVGILALALAVLALMHWLNGMSRTGATSVALATAVILPMWWLLGVTMAELPRWAPPLFLVAGASSSLTALPALARLTAWKRIACVALVAMVVVSPVVICGVRVSLKQTSSSASGD